MEYPSFFASLRKAMSRVVVTGANGLVGNEVARLLARGGNEVVCVGRQPPDISDAGVRFVEADLSQPLDRSSLPDSADSVIHLAQSPRFTEFPEGARDMFAVNVETPVALLDWARNAGVKSFAHASSGGVYGSGPTAFKESDPLQIPPRLAFYLSTKRCVEELGKAYQEFFSVTALRYFFVYGPRQRQTMLLSRLVTNVREGKPITLQGPDGMLLNPIHVYDAAAAAIAAVTNKASGIFNVAGPDVVNLRTIAETIGKHVGRSPVFQSVEGTPGHLIADTQHMRACLCAPTINVSAGLKELCDT